MTNQPLPAVFSEMLKSFTTLARTLNLSQAVDELQLTRQTIRRHIVELERIHGHSLLTLENRQYKLTDHGKDALPAAERLLTESEAWLMSGGIFPSGLTHTAHVIDKDRWLYSQQHPVNSLWQNAEPLICAGIAGWTEAEAELESDGLAQVRPYALVYRPYKDDWLCSEVGEKSSYADWFGWRMAKSSVGRHLSEESPYEKVYDYLVNAYRIVMQNGGLWYDHISASLPREKNGPPQPVHYQRLIAACRFPDGEPATLILVARTNEIDIPSLPEDRFQPLDDDDVMDFPVPHQTANHHHPIPSTSISPAGGA